MRWLAFLFIFVTCVAAEAAEIHGVRASHDNHRTRVVFDLSAHADYRVFTMRKPERVVVDFSDSRTPRALPYSPGVGDVIKRIRHAKRGESGVRVVLDLTAAVKVSAARLAPNQDYGHRIVLDLDSPAPTASSQRVAAGETRPAAVARPEASSAPRPAAQQVNKPRVLRDVTVAIDAGHGGADVGAIGPSGVYEKDITLAVARDLAALINRQAGMRAILTRQGDRYLKLRERMDRARTARADLFISVHADAFKDRRVKGSSVYVLSQRGASSEAAKWLADNENAADLIGGVSLDDKDAVLKSVLLDLSQTASIESSIDIGKHMLAALKRLGPVHKKKVQHAGFMVLKSPDIPSVLIETAFISNPDEEKRLSDRRFRARLASAMMRGVSDYFAANPPPDTRLAERRRHTVARGDTLSGIANRYEVSISSIKLANNLATELVRTGEILRIP